MKFCVITTIHPITEAVKKWHEIFGDRLIAVGDKKTPIDWNYKDAVYIPFVEKEKGWFEGVDPVNHYARKNLGYLEAIRRGATYIYSTDDDNLPNENWQVRTNEVSAYQSVSDGWFNTYLCMGSNVRHVWPRGFALNHLQKCTVIDGIKDNYNSSIQQGLADGEADVDALWRLVYGQKVFFENTVSVHLKQNTWCPFNSQSTHFFPKAFPLMYLPVTVSFRMTDIFGSFVGQRCLWELGEGVTFHSPSEVFQDRNKHDLLKDFEDEIPGYLNSGKLVKILEGLTLKKGEENVCDNMVTCYQALADENIVTELEIRCLKSWVKQYEAIITANMGRIAFKE